LKFRKSFWISLLGVLMFALSGAANVSAATKFADVSSYQPDDVVYFKSLATDQVAGVVVKLTEGSDYINPKANKQIASAQAAGLKVSLYHYAQYNGAASARNEANKFGQAAKNAGLSTDTVMVADVEDNNLKTPYADTVTFQKQLASWGYHNQVTYSMASWFWANKLPLNYPIWVANYSANMPQVDNAAAWQYTSNYGGKSVDMSYDFTGIFTQKNSSVTQAPTAKTVTIQYKPNYGIALWQGFGTNKYATGRYLKTGTSWRVLGEAVVNQQRWYNVGGDQWIQATYTSKPYGQYGLIQPKTVTTKTSGQLVNGLVQQKAIKTLASGTRWQVTGVATWAGAVWYNLGGNQWLSAKAVL